MFDLVLVGFSIWFFAKIFFLFGIGLYLIFALVVVKQVNLMTETIELPADPLLRTLAWAHLIFAMAIFLFALISL